jgi:hypothetical protein
VSCEWFPPEKAKSKKHAAMAAATTSTLKLITWNVWFDAFHAQARMDAIGSVVTAEQPHFIALQEMTQGNMAMLRRAEWSKGYYLSHPPNNNSWYFTLLLSKFPFVALKRRPYESQTKRDLLYAHIDVPTPPASSAAGTDAKSNGKGKDKTVLRRVVIATSHLESSTPQRRLRLGQLDLALQWLGRDGDGESEAEALGGGGGPSPIRTAIFCGDMNLHSSEGDKALLARSEWVDSWLSVHAGQGQGDAEAEAAARAAHLNGMTYCAKTNGMLSVGDPSGWGARLDRIYVRLEGGGGQNNKDAPAAVSAASSAAAADESPASASAAAAAAPVAPASPAPAPFASADWRIVSVDRLGLCALDLSHAHEYAQTKPYKTPAVVESCAGGGAAAIKSTPGGSANPVVFPSDHFGMLITLELAEGASTGAQSVATGQQSKDKCCIC